MILPEKVKKLLKVFEDNGFEAYLVGGAVRDLITGKPVYDYDVAVSAQPLSVKKLFSYCRVIETGIKHGTVTVIFDDTPFEITTFRSDGEYLDARHPSNVAFTTDIKNDLSRRDFTINAIAVDLRGNVVDPFGGTEDIKNGLIRTVGNPEERFSEDALRILRAVRFAAKTGFKVDEETFNASIRCRSSLAKISKERIFSELTKILLAPYASDALLYFKEIIFEVLPDLRLCDGFDQKSLAHDYDVYRHTLRALELLKIRTPVTVWVTLLHDVGKPLTLTVDKNGHGHFPEHMRVSAEIAEKLLASLKAPNDLKRAVVAIVLYHDEPFKGGKSDVKRFLNAYGAEIAKDLSVVKYADIYAHSEYGINKYLYQRVEYDAALSEVLDNGECYSLSDLCVKGSDLISLGYDGENIGKKLNELLFLVIDGKLENDKNELIGYLKRTTDG